MERRLTSILAADVARYSHLMGVDEAATLLALKAFRREVFEPSVARHEGRIFNTSGDGFLVEFPSIVNAVACALSVQEAPSASNYADIRLRIGINIGDVIVENGDLFGDGVNLASRLEGIAAPGGIVLSAAAVEQVGNRLRIELDDLGIQSLKNIDRPIRVYRIRGIPITDAKTRPALSLPDRPSIAVLPFQNIGEDPKQEYFADGVVEDIITGLSRIRWLFVIARNSSFVYRERFVDARQIGKELGVRYLLEGSVRRLNDQLRVTAQLIEAESGTHVWADKYDGTVQDVFDFQDSITEHVVGIVEPSVRRSEIERSRQKRQENLDAYDLFLRAMPYLQARMPDDAKLAIPLLEDALSIDPDYHAARAHLAWCHEWCFTRGGQDEEQRDLALMNARATLASDTDDAAALAITGWVVNVLTKETALAMDAIERALKINPSCATAHYFAALADSFASRASSARSHAHQALRLSPFDPSAFEAHLALGFVAIGTNELDEAIERFSTAARMNPKHSLFPFCHAISLALAGRLDEARPIARRGLELEPTFRIRIFSEFGMAPSLSQKFIQGARLLELPE